jgi:hypothetical protein
VQIKKNPLLRACSHFDTQAVFRIVGGILKTKWPKLGKKTINEYVEAGGFVYIGITKLKDLKGEALRWLTTRGKRKGFGKRVVYNGRNKPVLVWANG